jgi:hypothetical protein
MNVWVYEIFAGAEAVDGAGAEAVDGAGSGLIAEIRSVILSIRQMRAYSSGLNFILIV